MEFVIEGFACLTCGLLKVASLSLGRQFEGDIVNVAVDCAQHSHSRTHTQHILTLTLPHTHTHKLCLGQERLPNCDGFSFFFKAVKFVIYLAIGSRLALHLHHSTPLRTPNTPLLTSPLPCSPQHTTLHPSSPHKCNFNSPAKRILGSTTSTALTT